MMKYIKWISGMLLVGLVSQQAFASFESKWEAKHPLVLELYKSDFPMKLAPFVASETIYMASSNGKVSARHAQTGKMIWDTKTHLKLTAGPFYQNNKLFLGSQEGKLIVLDAANQGKVLWKAALSSEILASPKANDEFVFVNTLDGKFYALDLETGRIVWSFDRAVPQLILRQASAPVIQDNVVLSGFSSGKLLAFDTQTGALIWEKMVATPKGHSELDRMVDISADLLSNTEMVFSSAFQGQTVGIYIQSGGVAWEREIDTQHNMVLDQEVLYLTDNKNVLWALEAKTGATLWKQANFQQEALTGPAVYQDKLLVGSLSGQVLILDKKDGKLLEKKQFKGRHFGQAPVIGQDMAYFMSKEGNLSAIRIQF
jgi:outer membrane protein assembly factor BamB